MSFGSTAQTVTTLTNADNALSAINNDLDYSGGLTNHEQALIKCKETLPTGPDDPPGFILMVTDGVPSTHGTSGALDETTLPRTKALEVANSIKADGIRVETLHINPSAPNNESTEYMKALSSHDAFHDIADFANLADIVTQVSAEIGCNAVIRPSDIVLEDEYLTEEVPAPEVLNPVTTVPPEPLDAEAAAAEEAQLIENSEPNNWQDPAYVEIFPESVDIGEDPTVVNGITSFNDEDGVMTAKGTGFISQQADQLHFSFHEVYEKNWDFKVFVESFSGLEATSKAGLMARQTLKPGSAMFSTLIAGGNHVQVLYREENQAYVKNGNGNSTAEEDALIPYDTQGVWLRIKVMIVPYFYSYYPHYLSFEFV